MALTTRYLGLELNNPLVPSASPLTRAPETAKQLEDAGAAAIIMSSLFEEAITAEEEAMTRFLHHQDTGFAEADGFLPTHHEFTEGLDVYLEQLAALKKALDIPVIASLNGITPGGWTVHARELEQAGADALELNIYYVAADMEQTGAQVEARYLEVLAAVREQVGIPINMKLSPWFSALAHMVKQLEAGGANGVALFNRFYQPDINTDSMRLQPCLTPSTSAESLLAMRWVAMLHGRTQLSVGVTGGIHTADDAIKMLLAGADVVHLCSALLNHGPHLLGKLLRGLEEWMEEQGFETIDDFRGQLSQLSVPDPAEYERANYVNVLDSFSHARGVRV